MIPQDQLKRGGRPAAHSLLLTDNELEWMIRTFRRKADLVSKAKSSSKKLKEAIISIDDKLSLGATEAGKGYFLKLSRNELQVLLEIVKNNVTLLESKILPEYAARAATSPRQVEAFALYGTLLDLKRKGESVYDEGSHRHGNRRVPKS